MKLCRLLFIASVLFTGYVMVILAMMLPWVFAALVIGVVALMWKSGIRLTAFGTARWADTGDVRKAGMLDGNGLIVGRLGGQKSLKGFFTLFDPRVDSAIACEQFLAMWKKPDTPLVRLSNAVHTAVFAPTGVGKGVSCVIPFLQTCPDSCVVVDFKGENARLTAEHRRRAFGHNIVLIDPFRQVTQTPDTLNVLAAVDKDSPFAIDDCREIGAAIVDRKQEKGDGVHFLDNAEGGIAAVTATVVQFGDGANKSLQTVCDIVSHPQKWAKTTELMCGSDAWNGMLARMGGSLTHLKDRELASTMTTIARFLRFLSTPAIAESTRTSSFNPSDLLKGKTTIYLVVPPERAAALSSLLRLWVGALLRAVVRGGLQEKTKVHFVCDEANTLGKMDQISDALTIGRGFGIRMQLYYQDCGQLKKCWPDGADQTLLANVSQVFFGVNDKQTAEYVSSRLGESTILVQDWGANGGGSMQSNPDGRATSTHSWGWNENVKQQGRHLLRLEEVLALHQRTAITFTPGVPPMATTLVRYYEEGNLRGPGWCKRLWAKTVTWAAAIVFVLLAGSVAVMVSNAANRDGVVSFNKAR